MELLFVRTHFQVPLALLFLEALLQGLSCTPRLTKMFLQFHVLFEEDPIGAFHFDELLLHLALLGLYETSFFLDKAFHDISELSFLPLLFLSQSI